MWIRLSEPLRKLRKAPSRSWAFQGVISSSRSSTTLSRASDPDGMLGLASIFNDTLIIYAVPTDLSNGVAVPNERSRLATAWPSLAGMSLLPSTVDPQQCWLRRHRLLSVRQLRRARAALEPWKTSPEEVRVLADEQPVSLGCAHDPAAADLWAGARHPPCAQSHTVQLRRVAGSSRRVGAPTSSNQSMTSMRANSAAAGGRRLDKRTSAARDVRASRSISSSGRACQSPVSPVRMTSSWFLR